jgi:carotenoid cleavage dioxygenase
MEATNHIQANQPSPVAARQSFLRGNFAPVERETMVAPVYNAARDASEIHVIDAQRCTRGPVAVVELPVRIPFGFHGDFIAND